MPSNMKLIYDVLPNNGQVYINWCVNQPPYIHIMFVDIGDPRMHFVIPYHQVPKRQDTSKQTLQLETIANLQNASFNGNGIRFNGGVAINGFTWEGDKGFAAGQQGLPLGYLMSSGAELGGNRVGG